MIQQEHFEKNSPGRGAKFQGNPQVMMPILTKYFSAGKKQVLETTYNASDGYVVFPRLGGLPLPTSMYYLVFSFRT